VRFQRKGGERTGEVAGKAHGGGCGGGWVAEEREKEPGGVGVIKERVFPSGRKERIIKNRKKNFFVFFFFK